MAKPTRKKPEALPYEDPPPWTGKALVATAVLGAVLGVLSTYVHYRVRWSGGVYTSFCNVSEHVNCDDVVTSPYGIFLGVPVSIWAIGFYLLFAFVARRASGARSAERNRARADLLLLALGGAAFSLYLAVVSVAVLGTICLLCAGLYVVSLASVVLAFVHAAPLARAVDHVGERWRQLRERPAMATALAGAIVAVLVLPSWLGAPTRLTREEVFKADPGFYDWYTGQPVVEPPASGGVSVGPADAKITMIEFSDFQCPHCRLAHVVLKDVLPRYGNDVRFVFYQYPLSNECNDSMPSRGHENACGAAAASICADAQGRFKPMADILFANQDALEKEKLEGYADTAGLDLDQFRTCLASEETKARIKADVAAGQRAGVVSTPTFLINGRRVQGNMPFQNWLMALAVELDPGS